MPRKSIVNELQAEEAAASSPRRSSRIVNGTNGTPAGVTTRRASQTTESSDTPARATRGRRTSTQAPEEKVEPKTVTRSRRASFTAEEDSQKETVAPARRGRKPSVTSEPTLPEEPEKPKPVRGRRTSRANSEDNEEEKPQKSAPIRGRGRTASIELEAEVKAPAKPVTRRRSSATEPIATEAVATPAKRTTRGRKASDSDEVFEETKKPATRGRRKSVTLEEETKVEEVTKPITRRGRRGSTDEAAAVATVPKTPGRSTRRSSINKEADILEEEHKNSPVKTEEEVLNNVPVRLTPLKKRKIVEKVEAELDLSIINESSDDVNSSKHEASLKDSPVNSNSSINEPIIETATKDSTDISPSSKVSPNNRKRLSLDVGNETSPRKSPRLTEKLSDTPQNVSKNNTPQKALKATPRKSRNILKEDSQEVIEKSHSFVSSGSDGSFMLHLSTVSMSDSVQCLQQEDVLNTSKESSGSNKENIELIEDTYEKTVVIPVQEPIVVARISNVFKPNQKEYSFMEPMEVDESVRFVDNSLMDKSVASDECSVIFNRNAPIAPITPITGNKADSSSDSFNETLPNQSSEETHIHKPSFTETEGSDNLLIEETEKTLEISVKQRKSENALPVSPAARRSKSPRNIDAVEKVKVLSGKSSSPLNIKKSVRRSKSPLPNSESTDSENDHLSVSKPNRKSKTPSPRNGNLQVPPRKSKSKTPSPRRLSEIKKDDVNQAATSDVNVEVDAKNSSVDRDNSTLSSNKATRSKSPRPLQPADKTLKDIGETLNEAKVDLVTSNDSHEKDPTETALNQNKTEYHTALATTNTDSEFNSIVNIDDDVTQSELKLSESTHYDFDLPSDDDDLLDSKDTTRTSLNEAVLEADKAESIEASNLAECSKENVVCDIDSKDLKSGESETDTLEVNNSPKESDVEQIVTGEEKNEEITKDAENVIHENKESEEQLDPSKCSEDKNTENSDENDIEPGSEEIVDASIKENEIALETDRIEIVSSPKKNSELNTTSDHSKSDSVATDPVKPDELKQDNDSSHESQVEFNVENNRCEDVVDDEDSEHKQTKSPCKIEEENGELDEALEESKLENDVTDKSPDEKENGELDEPLEESKLENEVTDKSLVEKENGELDEPLDELELEDKSPVKLDASKVELKESDYVVEDKGEEKIMGCKSEEKIGPEENMELDETLEDISTCKMAKKADKVESPKNPSKNDSPKPTKSRSSLDEFATVKLSEYIKSKVHEINEEESSSEDEDAADEEESESEKEYNEFIDGMAEEGEEDTPSEDSNEIIDEGESIGSADSDEDVSGGDYDEDDSFICDEEDQELLSGEEYDLGNEKKKKSKKTRIIDISTLDDDEIIKVPNKKPDTKSPKKKSRIIKISDSSSDEEAKIDHLEAKSEKSATEKGQSSDDSVIAVDSKVEEDESVIQNISRKSLNKSSLHKTTEENSNIISIDIVGDSKVDLFQNETQETSSVIIIEDSRADEHESVIQNISRKSLNSSSLQKVEENSDIISIEDCKEEEVSDNKSIHKNVLLTTLSTSPQKAEENSDIISIEDCKEEEVNDNKSIHQNVSLTTLNTSPQKKTEREEPSNNESTFHNVSVSALNTSLQKRNRRSSLSIHENIVVDGLKDLTVSKRINTLVETFCSTVKKGEIALNLSLEYEDVPESSAKEVDAAENIHILSNVRYCPGAEPKSDQEDNSSSEDAGSEKELNISDEPVQDLRQILNKKKLKRRLSKSLSEIYEEQTKSKRRKIQKKAKQEEKQKRRLRPDLSEKLGSFSLMNQLITDVKNRPRRALKPSKNDSDSYNSWTTTKISNLKPSTKPVTKEELIKLTPKLHPKDFKNMLLSDPKRVKRIETKTLLKKRGANL